MTEKPKPAKPPIPKPRKPLTHPRKPVVLPAIVTTVRAVPNVTMRIGSWLYGWFRNR